MAEEYKKSPAEVADDDFMATARKRFEQDVDEERELRAEAEIDVRFEAGDQWDEKVRQERESAGRPALTFNRTHTFIQQVANEARQNKAQIKFNPAEDGDEDTAEIYEGLARHIQYSSDAQVAYETAVECAAGSSFGYFRYLTDYCNEENFDQELNVVPVFNPFAVYGILIPACLGIQARHAFVVEYMDKEEYEEQFPDSTLASMDWADAKATAGDWLDLSENKVRVAEYWTVDYKKKVLKSGRRERTVFVPRVKFCKINGVERLKGSETEWPGPIIPIIPVLGKLKFVDGRPRLFSVIRFQRAAQKLLNIYKTRIAETLMTSPIQPYLVPKGSVAEQDRTLWERMNTELRPFLEYQLVDASGKPIPPPTRQVFEPPIASLSVAAAQEVDDMKAEAGIFDPSLGSGPNDKSGIAIQRRQQQSSITNLHFLDNLERAFQTAGKKVLAPVIPKIYDTPRMIRILGEDETPKVVRVNQAFEQNGQVKRYKIGGRGVGKYDVVVTMGRSFSTKRLESFDMMAQLLQGNPQILPMIGDLLFRNSDLAGADQLAERFKKMLPPNLQDQDDADPAQMAAMMQAKLMEAQQQLQALNAYAQKVEGQYAEIKQTLDGKLLEIDSRERIEMEKLRLEAAKIESNEALKVLELRIKAIEAQMTASAEEMAREAEQASEVIQAGN